MKRSEYKKEVNRLIKLSQKIDERLELQFQMAKWLDEHSDNLSRRIDNVNSEDCQQREVLIKEAEELLGRILSERRIISEDRELEDELYKGLDILTGRVIKEGIETD